METLGERLRYALELRGMSQSELARRVGVKPQAVQFICSGKGHSSRYIAQFARVLGVSPAWLAEGRGPVVPEGAETSEGPKIVRERGTDCYETIDEEAREIARRWETLPEWVKRAIRAMIFRADSD